MTQPACRKLAIAPMMDRTDRHFRLLMRLVAPRAWLYTEMLTAQALVHGDAGKLLAHDAREHPVAVQLGGSDPELLARAALLAADAGYDEVNLNVGCPSDRVQAGCFGAALMLDRERVADCVRAIGEAVPVPVTVKTRTGVDDRDSYEFLHGFAAAVAAAGCGTLIVHARKAWLKGLSPKQNREIPPLDYARVHRLKRDFPALEVLINGGLTTVDDALAQLEHVDGLMLGRTAYDDPMLIGALARAIDARDDGRAVAPDRADAPGRGPLVRAYLEHVERELAAGTPLRSMTRHLTGLFAREPGARRWRRGLSTSSGGYAGLDELRALVDETTASLSQRRREDAGVYRAAGTRYNRASESAAV